MEEKRSTGYGQQPKRAEAGGKGEAQAAEPKPAPAGHVGPPLDDQAVEAAKKHLWDQDRGWLKADQQGAEPQKASEGKMDGQIKKAVEAITEMRQKLAEPGAASPEALASVAQAFASVSPATAALLTALVAQGGN